MNAYASIGLLFLGVITGGLASSDNAPALKLSVDLYVFNGSGIPIKIDFSVPDPPDVINATTIPNHVFFYLYTRDAKNESEKLFVDDVGTLKNSHFDPKRPTKFVTHGWITNYQSSSCTLIRDAFLKHGDYNVIVVDWGSIANGPYLWASNQVVKIAKFIASMINFLESNGMNTSDVTVVGHSLGAHVAGLSSYYANNKVNYVVALDPASPTFNLKGKSSKVTKEDAKYVEVIHTTNLLGLIGQHGDSDFYPDGGVIQNNCLNEQNSESCSHSRSYEYFAESINSDGFLAHKCNSFILYQLGACNSNSVASMGGVTPHFNVTGKYYLTTNSKPPYAKN